MQEEVWRQTVPPVQFRQGLTKIWFMAQGNKSEERNSNE